MVGRGAFTILNMLYVNLYSPEGEITNPVEDLLGQLRLKGLTPYVSQSHSEKVEVTGDLDGIIEAIRDWQGERPGRTSQPQLLSRHLQGEIPAVTITVQPTPKATEATA